MTDQTLPPFTIISSFQSVQFDIPANHRICQRWVSGPFGLKPQLHSPGLQLSVRGCIALQRSCKCQPHEPAGKGQGPPTQRCSRPGPPDLLPAFRGPRNSTETLNQPGDSVATARGCWVQLAPPPLSCDALPARTGCCRRCNAPALGSGPEARLASLFPCTRDIPCPCCAASPPRPLSPLLPAPWRRPRRPAPAPI